MQPPGDAVSKRATIDSKRSEYGAKEGRQGRPGMATSRYIIKALNQGQRQNDQEDQTQDDKAIPGTMQGALGAVWA